MVVSDGSTVMELSWRWTLMEGGAPRTSPSRLEHRELPPKLRPRYSRREREEIEDNVEPGREVSLGALLGNKQRSS